MVSSPVSVRATMKSAGAPSTMACKADAAADRVRALLADRDPWLRILAAEALARMGPQERTASVPALLRAVAINAGVAMPGKDATQRWADQMQKANPAGRAAILALLTACQASGMPSEV